MFFHKYSNFEKYLNFRFISEYATRSRRLKSMRRFGISVFKSELSFDRDSAEVHAAQGGLINVE